MGGGTSLLQVALVRASVLFDLVGLLAPDNGDKSRRAGFRAAGFYTLILGALGSLGAVLSGLVISRGQLWGRGNLAHHHMFLWPAFGLLTGLAVWRLVVGNPGSNHLLKLYLGAGICAA